MDIPMAKQTNMPNNININFKGVITM